MKKYKNFCDAFVCLKEIFDYEEPYSNVELAGLVALYEICFEQSWKLMKELLENAGFEESVTGSPKSILKTAYRAGMIKSEQSWLDALSARNNVAHAYNKGVALDIVRQAKATFYELFSELKKEIDDKWLD